MKFKPYEEYKKVDLPWIDEIPSHWEINKVKYLCRINTGTKDTIDRVDDGLYPFFVRSKKVYRINSFSYDGEAVLTAGDGDIGEIFHYIDGKFDYHQRVYLFSQFRNIKPKYFYYYLKSNLKNGIVMYTAKTTVNSLRLPWLKNFNFVLPPKEEQDKIAAFLDHNLAKIDKFVELTERQIELLKEQKEVIINDAVTKGIDKNVEYKDSGIDWIGEIPSHWEVIRLKYISKILNGATPSSSVPEFWNGDISWITPKDLSKVTKCIYDSDRKITSEGYKSCSTSLIPENNIIMATRAPIGSIKINKTETTINQGCKAILVDKSLIDLNYLYFSLNNSLEELQFLGNGSTFVELSAYSLSQFKINIPPKKEQKDIVAYIEEETNKIDRTIELYKKQVELIKEYRTSLISTAVTGKIDVRDFHIV
ncbi:MAG: restriction endonuclease subunit S [Tissierellaceae bacterium]